MASALAALRHPLAAALALRGFSASAAASSSAAAPGAGDQMKAVKALRERSGAPIADVKVCSGVWRGWFLT